MTAYFIVVFLLYYASILLLVWGWIKAKRYEQRRLSQNHFLSVVIAFRNEETNLSDLLTGLQKQSYSTEKHEVILVDDHSGDRSAELVKQFQSSGIRLVQLPADRTGKKAALDFGIRQAKGEIIVTTDADCFVLPDWLQSINAQFQNDKVKMTTGLVRIDESASLFSKIQAMEFVSLMGTTGATLSLDLPTMCNGANLAFLKSAYLEVNGYEGNEDIPSGDDEFLMRKIAARWRDSIRFMDDQKAIVSTPALASFPEWISQRLRWAGKWKYNSSIITKTVALFVIGFHLSFLVFVGLTLSGQFDWRWLALFWGTKMLIEATFLIPVSKTLQLGWRWIPFFILQFTYSLYVVVIGILSQVKGYQWKGRRVGPKMS